MNKLSTPKAPESPHLAARREWNERYGGYIQRAATWRAMAFGSLAVAGIAVAGLAYQASSVKFVPYVVEVDKLSATLPVGPADRAAKGDTRIIRAQLAGFVDNLRSVYLDAAAEQNAVKAGYALLDPNMPAFKVVNEYMAANDPFKRAQRESVSVEIRSVLPVGGDVWRVEWEETVRGRDGDVISQQNWQASITTELRPPTTEVGVLTNPIGIYVTGISWSPRTQ